MYWRESQKIPKSHLILFDFNSHVSSDFEKIVTNQPNLTNCKGCCLDWTDPTERNMYNVRLFRLVVLICQSAFHGSQLVSCRITFLKMRGVGRSFIPRKFNELISPQKTFEAGDTFAKTHLSFCIYSSDFEGAAKKTRSWFSSGVGWDCSPGEVELECFWLYGNMVFLWLTSSMLHVMFGIFS